MLATFQALAVFVTTILPGLLFTLAFERESAGTSKTEFNERFLAFTAVSSLFAIVSAPLLYQGYRLYIASGSISRGEPVSAGVWWILAAYVLIPLVLGGWLGHQSQDRRAEGDGVWPGVLRIIGGPLNGWTPDPRAWERLFFTKDLGGHVKIRLKDETLANKWILGVWAKPDPASGIKRPGSYASGYPYEQDIYFFDTCDIDADGTIPSSDPTQVVPIPRGVACLINWSDIAYAEFIE
ncbi:DUF6338 family protein [Rhodococcoides fascians]|uniref:DUF6338 family protein n=1 Tax=Rhodococcoides fascians TaxID=1828 RepID=UPI00050C94BE|nr:DUF6338 family protein [Rhodococcus fascians]